MKSNLFLMQRSRCFNVFCVSSSAFGPPRYWSRFSPCPFHRLVIPEGNDDDFRGAQVRHGNIANRHPSISTLPLRLYDLDFLAFLIVRGQIVNEHYWKVFTDPMRLSVRHTLGRKPRSRLHGSSRLMEQRIDVASPVMCVHRPNHR